MRDDQRYNPLKNRIAITPQGQVVQSPTGPFALYVDLEIALERAKNLEKQLEAARARIVELEGNKL